MDYVMTAKELARRCRQLATEHKSLYILGCFGAPMTAKNRQRYANNYAFNRQPERSAKIRAADEETFGFDCVGMIKGILWGWCADDSKTYGGAKYQSNGVSDSNADSLFRKCTGQSQDFSCVEIGEAVWKKGHIGIYIGEGLVVECSPKWADGVQITACNCKKQGYHTRTWSKHGKLPYVSYEDEGLAWFRSGVELMTEGKALPVCSERENRVHILVWLAQKRLGDLGYAAFEADGIFGPMTLAAVERYQKDKGCQASGKLDGATWCALLDQEVAYE